MRRIVRLLWVAAVLVMVPTGCIQEKPAPEWVLEWNGCELQACYTTFEGPRRCDPCATADPAVTTAAGACQAGPEPPRPAECGGGDTSVDADAVNDSEVSPDADVTEVEAEVAEVVPDDGTDEGQDEAPDVVDEGPEADQGPDADAAQETDEGPDAGCSQDCDALDTVCEDYSCVAGSCEPAFTTSPCDDGDDCTDNDVCTAGVCAGEPVYDASGDFVITATCPGAGLVAVFGVSTRSDGGAVFVTQNTACGELNIGTSSTTSPPDGSSITRVLNDGTIFQSQQWPGFVLNAVDVSSFGDVVVGGQYTTPLNAGGVSLPAPLASANGLVMAQAAGGGVDWTTPILSADDNVTVNGVLAGDDGTIIVVGATGNDTLTSVGEPSSLDIDTTGNGIDGLILRLDSATGQALWGRTLGSTDGFWKDEAVAVDRTVSGDLLILADFKGPASISHPSTPLIITAAGDHLALIRMTDDGTPVSAFVLPSTLPNVGFWSRLTSVGDAAIVTSVFTGQASFAGTATQVDVSADESDSIVLQVDALGKAVSWTQLGGPGSEQIFGVSSSASQVVVTLNVTAGLSVDGTPVSAANGTVAVSLDPSDLAVLAIAAISDQPLFPFVGRRIKADRLAVGLLGTPALLPSSVGWGAGQTVVDGVLPGGATVVVGLDASQVEQATCQ